MNIARSLPIETEEDKFWCHFKDLKPKILGNIQLNRSCRKQPYPKLKCRSFS